MAFIASIFVVTMLTLFALFGMNDTSPAHQPLVLWSGPLLAGGFIAWVVNEIRAIGRSGAR